MEKNKTIISCFYEEVFNKGNLSAIDELFDKNFVDRSFAGREASLKEVRLSFKELRKSFPDARIKIHDMLAENNKVATRFTFNGTHKGKFMGHKPTNKKVSMAIIDIIRIKNGKIVERWGIEDNLSLWQQLGKKLKN